MGKDSSPTSSHFPVTRRYSSSMTHHILEKVWYESSQAHKCGEKRPRHLQDDITEQDPHTIEPSSSRLLHDLHHDTPTPPVTPAPAYAESSPGHPSLSPPEFELSCRPFTH
ncbi:hypothetical protein AAG906_033426 [Vitis piasezkii]